MMIFDKAVWQIDHGMEKDQVIKHFEAVFDWLNKHNMLNDNGKELLDIGIDSQIYLGEQLVTEDGKKFLENYYNDIISDSKYDPERTLVMFDKYIHK